MPLTSSELEHALAVNNGDSKLDKENISQVEDMITLCAGLVTLDKETGITRLVHYPTQEFFQRTKTKWFPNIQTDITNICATYLSFAHFQNGYCQSDEQSEERMEDYALYDYASHYWGFYAREAHDSSSELITFLEKKPQVQASIIALFVLLFSWEPEYSPFYPEDFTTMHLIAYFGIKHLSIMRKFILKASFNTGKVDVNLKNSEFSGTPVTWATVNGHVAVVELLLRTENVDVDAKDSNNWTPLSLAVWYGHESVVKLLLDSGKIDIDPSDSQSLTPLSWAAGSGNEGL